MPYSLTILIVLLELTACNTIHGIIGIAEDRVRQVKAARLKMSNEFADRD